MEYITSKFLLKISESKTDLKCSSGKNFQSPFILMRFF